MRVIYTSKGMSKKFGVRVIYRKIRYLHSHPGCLAPREGTLELTECEAVWAPEPFWTLWGMVNSLALPGTEPQFLAVSLVSTAEVFSVPKFGTLDPDKCESVVSFSWKY